MVVKTKSGKLILGLQAGNRLSWPERSGQDLAVRISSDQGKTWGPIIVAAEAGDFSCQCHGLFYEANHDKDIIFQKVSLADGGSEWRRSEALTTHSPGMHQSEYRSFIER